MTFGDTRSYTFAGSINGIGGVVKQGSGIQTFTGASTFTGGLTVAEGTVALGMGGSLSPISRVNLANPGTYFDIRAARRSNNRRAVWGIWKHDLARCQ
ncbi:hypothetical protein HGG72_15555 [Ochrobactrum pecoris]|nr:hypothetical protein [Brucella pecoris]